MRRIGAVHQKRALWLFFTTINLGLARSGFECYLVAPNDGGRKILDYKLGEL